MIRVNVKQMRVLRKAAKDVGLNIFNTKIKDVRNTFTMTAYIKIKTIITDVKSKVLVHQSTFKGNIWAAAAND